MRQQQQDGLTFAQIAAEHGIKATTVSRYLQPAADTDEPPQAVAANIPDLSAQAAVLYRQPGVSMEQASRQLNISRTVMLQLLSSAGIGKLCLDCKVETEPASGHYCPACSGARRERRRFRPRSPAKRNANLSERRAFQGRFIGETTYLQCLLADVRYADEATIRYECITAPSDLWSRGLPPGTPIRFYGRVNSKGVLCYITRTDPPVGQEAGAP